MHLNSVNARRDRIAAEIENVLADAKVRNEDEVRRFLYDNHDLIEVVHDTVRLVRQHFREDHRAIILWVDEEADSDPYLTIGVQTALPPRVALDRLRAFDSEWLPAVDDYTKEHILPTLVMTK